MCVYRNPIKILSMELYPFTLYRIIYWRLGDERNQDISNKDSDIALPEYSNLRKRSTVIRKRLEVYNQELTSVPNIDSMQFHQTVFMKVVNRAINIFGIQNSV